MHQLRFAALVPAALGRETPATGAVADFTDIWTAEGWLYVAVVLDLFSRRIVGLSVQNSMTSQFMANALMMVVWRLGRLQELLHHSDHGTLQREGDACSLIAGRLEDLTPLLG